METFNFGVEKLENAPPVISEQLRRLILEEEANRVHAELLKTLHPKSAKLVTDYRLKLYVGPWGTPCANARLTPSGITAALVSKDANGDWKYSKNAQPVQKDLVAKYALELKRGKFTTANEYLRMDTDGTFYDGQHRCLGAIGAMDKHNVQVDLPIAISFENPPSDRMTTDAGTRDGITNRIRSVHESDPKFVGVEVRKLHTSVASAVMQLDSDKQTKFADSVIDEFICKNLDAIEWVEQRIPGHGGKGRMDSGITIPVKAALVRAYYHVDKEWLDTVCSILRDPSATVITAKEKKIAELRYWLMSNNHGKNNSPQRTRLIQRLVMLIIDKAANSPKYTLAGIGEKKVVKFVDKNEKSRYELPRSKNPN